MDIDQLVTDTFTAHEDLCPDEDTVLAGVQGRIRRRSSALVQPMAVAASVAVVVGTSVAVGLVSRDHRDGASPSPQRPPVSAAAPQQSAHPAPVRSSASTVHPLTMPFDLGWLPSGSVAYYARRINLGSVSDSGPLSFDGEYLLSVTTASQVIDVDVQQMPGGLAGTRFKSGAGAEITINGRPGIESVHAGGPGGYEVYFRDSAGGTMYVNAGPHADAPAPTAAELTAIGRQVAHNITFPGTAQVTPSFNVGDLPDGLRMRSFDVESADIGLPRADGTATNPTSYDVGTSDDSAPDVTVGEGLDQALPGSTPGRTVQGHPTRHAVDHGYVTLQVLDAVNGNQVSLAGRVPLAQLYAIADGLVLPS